MDWSSLELKVISCTDLKAFNFFQKLSVYSVVSIVNEQAKKKEEQHKRLQRQKTSIDRGGKNPEWNHVFQFDLKSLPSEETDRLFLKFDLRHEGLVGRTIGEARVPLKDLIEEFCGVVRFVSYQVRNSDGKPNGLADRINVVAANESMNELDWKIESRKFVERLEFPKSSQFQVLNAMYKWL
ncbi:uncharacterized protein LOC110413411 [Herrania umbratica]|uniref:Uncharacterized protein LOC110413411 n=1 Tax=Herrania umbratica TaxID=108875 RepID=A0A6J0ZZV0_9ROSI|nr:uncharacterized protein LOC110413411 [Herrania umbratica]